MKLQPGIVAGKAGQRIRPSDAGTGPQQQVLTCTIAQRPLRQQTQAQHAAAQPLGALHLSGQSVAAGIEDFYTEILLDTALTGQAPAGRMLLGPQQVGLQIARCSVDTAHQAGVAAAGAATVGYGQAGSDQGIEQVGSGRDRPALAGAMQLRHRR